MWQMSTLPWLAAKATLEMANTATIQTKASSLFTFISPFGMGAGLPRDPYHGLIRSRALQPRGLGGLIPGNCKELTCSSRQSPEAGCSLSAQLAGGAPVLSVSRVLQ